MPPPHTYTLTRLHACKHLHACTQTQTHTLTHTLLRTHTLTHTLTHTPDIQALAHSFSRGGVDVVASDGPANGDASSRFHAIKRGFEMGAPHLIGVRV